MDYGEPVFENLVRSIVYQQLSGRVAGVIFGRLKAALGDGPITPAGILKLRTERMRRLGLSGQADIVEFLPCGPGERGIATGVVRRPPVPFRAELVVWRI